MKKTVEKTITLVFILGIITSCIENVETENNSITNEVQDSSTLKIFVQGNGEIIANNKLIELDELESVILNAQKRKRRILYSKSLIHNPPKKITTGVLDIFVNNDVSVELYMDSLFKKPAKY